MIGLGYQSSWRSRICQVNFVEILIKTSMACVCVLGHVQFFATPWTVTHQALLSMEFSRQEYRNGLPFSSPGDLPEPGIEPGSPALQADSLPTELDECVMNIIY